MLLFMGNERQMPPSYSITSLNGRTEKLFFINVRLLSICCISKVLIDEKGISTKKLFASSEMTDIVRALIQIASVRV